MNLLALLYLFISSSFIGGMAICRKFYQDRNGIGLASTALFSAVSFAFSVCFGLFFISNYSFDPKRLGFASFYAFISVLISSACLVGGAWGRVSILILFANLSQLVFPSLYGIITSPSENKITLFKGIGFLLSFFCLAVSLVSSKKEKAEKEDKKFKYCCFAVFIAQGFALIIFDIIDSIYGTAQNANFITEYMFVALIMTLIILALLKLKSPKQKILNISKKHIVPSIIIMLAYAVFCFASEMLSIKCISIVPLTFQAPVSFCIPIVVTALLEWIFFKVKLKKSDVIQIIAASAACICFVL